MTQENLIEETAKLIAQINENLEKIRELGLRPELEAQQFEVSGSNVLIDVQRIDISFWKEV